MRYCEFCNQNFLEDDSTHWVSNGTLKPRCRPQRVSYGQKNRNLIRQRQNEQYRLNKRKTPSKSERLEIIRTYLSKFDIEVISSKYINNKSYLDLRCLKCDKPWKANWNNLNSGSSCPECAKINRANTNTARYGASNPTKNSSIRLKAAKSSNKIIEVKHWKTGATVFCQGSYEVIVARYLNLNKIDYVSQDFTFQLSNGSTYTPDYYLIDTDLFIEVKGYMYPDAKSKIDMFRSEYNNKKIEIWDKDKIKELKVYVAKD